MPDYPAAFDDLAVDLANHTLSKDVHPGLHNEVDEILLAIEHELGLNPSGESATVAARATAIEEALVVVSGGANSIGRRILRKLTEGEDCSVVVVGDSTGAAFATWVGKVLEGLAARFPAITFKYRAWDTEKEVYGEALEKQKGTGTKTCTFYNASVASTPLAYHTSRLLDAMVASKQPDLIFLSHGHNQGGAGAPAEPYWRDSLSVGAAAITRACPMSELVLIAQNPRVDANKEVHATRQFVTEAVAQLRGYGFVNVHRLFLDADPAVKSLLSDEIHPNAAGHTLWANEILRLLNLEGRIASQQRSSLLTPALNYLFNGDFASFAVPALANWTLGNVTLSKDVVNYESPNGYSVKMVTTAPGASSFINQTHNGQNLRRMLGEWITFVGKIWVPIGQNQLAGQLRIIEAGGSHAGTSNAFHSQDESGKAFGTGGWRYSMVSRRIGTESTGVTFQVLLNEAVGSAECSVDRLVVAPGIWPKDIRA